MTSRKATTSITKLSELQPDANGATNLACVVISCSDSRPTSGTSNLVKLELVDESCEDLITCLMFSNRFLNTVDRRALSIPCVILIHRAKVINFQGRLQINFCPSSSWVFYDSSKISPRPVQKSHPKAGLGPLTHEIRHICRLNHWISSGKCDPGLFRSLPARPPNKEKTSRNLFNDEPVTFSQLTSNFYFNMIAMVIGSYQPSSVQVVLRCMDGTRVALPILQCSAPDIRHHLTLTEAELLQPYCLDVHVYNEHVEKALDLQVGDMVQFHNLHCYIPKTDSSIMVVLHGGSSFGRDLACLPPLSEPSCQVRASVEATMTSVGVRILLSSQSHQGSPTEAKVDADPQISPIPQAHLITQSNSGPVRDELRALCLGGPIDKQCNRIRIQNTSDQQSRSGTTVSLTRIGEPLRARCFLLNIGRVRECGIYRVRLYICPLDVTRENLTKPWCNTCSKMSDSVDTCDRCKGTSMTLTILISLQVIDQVGNMFPLIVFGKHAYSFFNIPEGVVPNPVLISQLLGRLESQEVEMEVFVSFEQQPTQARAASHPQRDPGEVEEEPESSLRKNSIVLYVVNTSMVVPTEST